MASAADGGIRDTGVAESIERTGRAVDEEGQVVVYLRGRGDFRQVVVLVVAHQAAGHLVARLACGHVTVAGVLDGVCLRVPRAADHRSHYLLRRRGEHIDGLVGGHVQRQRHDVLVLHAVDDGGHVELQQVRGRYLLRRPVLLPYLAYIGDGDGDFHSHVLGGGVFVAPVAVLVVVGPLHAESGRTTEPGGFIKQRDIWSRAAVHGLEHHGLAAARCRQRYHDVLLVGPGVLLRAPVHGGHLVVALDDHGVGRQVYQLQAVVLGNGGLALDVQRNVCHGLGHGAHLLVFLRRAVERCVGVCRCVAVVAVPDVGNVAGGALHLQFAAGADGFDGEVSVAQLLVVVERAAEVQVLAALHHGHGGMEAVGVELVAAAVLADGAVASDDVAGGVYHHGIVRLREFHVNGVLAVFATRNNHKPVGSILTWLCGRTVHLALPLFSVMPYSAGLHPVFLFPTLRWCCQLLVELSVCVTGIVCCKSMSQPPTARQVFEVVGLADLLTLLE